MLIHLGTGGALSSHNCYLILSYLRCIYNKKMAELNINGYLSPEKEQLISIYRNKWKKIARSTQPIDREKAATALKSAYAWVGRQEPKIFFFESPNAALNAAANQFWEPIQEQLSEGLVVILGGFIDIKYSIFSQVMSDSLADYLWQSLWVQLEENLRSQLATVQAATSSKDQFYGECIEIEDWVCYSSLFDFCFSVMKYDELAQQDWEIFRTLSSEFYWLYPYENICLVCDRPIKILLDGKDRVHAEEEPAIQFADGFSVYARHGRYIHHEIISLS